MIGQQIFLTALLIVALLAVCNAFYLPGVAPVDYYPGANVELKASQLQSSKSQLPYGPYSLPFCQPDPIIGTAENLGEILRGDKIKNSPYHLYMQRDSTCNPLCKKTYKTPERKKFTNRIEDEYTVNWIVDNLPAATAVFAVDEKGHKVKQYQLGFQLGFKDGKELRYLNNHVVMLLMYHPNPINPGETEATARIVGFEVKAMSVNHKWDDPAAIKPSTCDALQEMLKGGPAVEQLVISGDGDIDVTWTYDVMWEERDDIEWASRWDTYLLVQDENVLWFSIINSFMISLFLSGVVAMIMLRTVHQDFARYNQLEATEEAQEETGWKLVHGDVFRPPTNPILFAVTVGSGAQVFCMVLATIIFAVLGFLSPANRGALLSAMVMTYMFFGVVAGQSSARIYKSFVHHGIGQAPGWKRLTILTAILYPGSVFALIFFLNFFAAIFIELYFIFNSIWQHQLFYAFGFLFLVFVIMTVMSAEIAIVLMYFQLCSEDYLWWWRSIFTPGSSAFYMFLYAISFYTSRSSIRDGVSTLLFFTYTTIMCLVLFLMTGAVGFFACDWFARRVFAEVKVD